MQQSNPSTSDDVSSNPLTSSLPHPPLAPSAPSTPNRIDRIEHDLSSLQSMLANLTTLMQANQAHNESQAYVAQQHPRPSSINSPDDTPASHLPPLMRNHPPPPESVSTSVFANPHKAYGGLVKFKTPQMYFGKPDDDVMVLDSFITKVGYYLEQVGIHPDSAESLRVTGMQLLSDNALSWFEYLRRTEPDAVTCWSELRDAMIERFRPMAQEQMTLNKLLDLRYNGRVANYNSKFMQYLQLLPKMNNKESQPMLMGVYIKGIEMVSGTSYICTLLRTAMNRKEIKSLTELFNHALLAEQALSKSSGRSSSSSSVSSKPYVPSSSSSHSSSKPHWRSSSSSSSSSSRFASRTPVSKPSFSTPAHHVNNVTYEEENDAAELDAELNGENNDAEYSNVDSDDDNNNPIITPEPSSEDDALLHQLQMFHKTIQRHPKLTPDEYDRRRRNNACFKCNRTGHYANKCTSKDPK